MFDIKKGAPSKGPNEENYERGREKDTNIRSILNAQTDRFNTQRFITRARLGRDIALSKIAKSLGINADALGEFGLNESARYRQTRVEVPIVDREGENRGSWILKTIPASGGSHQLTLSGPKGSDLPVGLPSLDYLLSTGRVYLSPDIPAVIALWYNGYPAIHLDPRTPINDDIREELESASRIIVIAGRDRLDRQHFEGVRKAGLMERAECIEIPTPHEGGDGDNVSEVEWLAEQHDMAQPEPLTEVYSRWKRTQRDLLMPMCKDLLEEKSLLSRFERDLERSGFAGDTRTAKIVFLAMVSRLLANPVSLAIKSVSSAGKSFTLSRVREFFPEACFVSMGAMSEKALMRSNFDLHHKVLIVTEEEGVSGKFATYVIRLLLSEKKMEYGSLVEQQGDWKGKKFVLEGPASFITTTTKHWLHPENETRLLSISTDESSEQTARIMRTIAQGGGVHIDISQWHALHTYLEFTHVDVHIPYAASIAELVPPVATRLRRDMTTILSLVKSHALLHDGTRERDARGRLIATIDDYRAVYDLTHHLFAEAVERAIPVPVRRLIEAVQEINEEIPPLSFARNPATYDELMEKLGLDRANVSRSARKAIDLGYIVDAGSSGGHKCELYATSKLSDDRAILPSPDDVLHEWKDEQESK